MLQRNTFLLFPGTWGAKPYLCSLLTHDNCVLLLDWICMSTLCFLISLFVCFFSLFYFYLFLSLPFFSLLGHNLERLLSSFWVRHACCTIISMQKRKKSTTGKTSLPCQPCLFLDNLAHARMVFSPAVGERLGTNMVE